ncbi:uncharacterized protein LOC120903217 [Anopheles arabiensis]|uniref:uncharacterized protein LOC120903217 n=1 Tax=Anopheles arabiensis TaxID=7173 RepID=UPI001AACF8F8|nr:uncharacterized protein LOC120903217 [Anopheles arabiensis]
MFRFVVLVVVLQSSLPYYRQHAVGVKLSIDSFEQTLGQDILWMDLRVRKYNRTSTVINGTIHIYQEGINDYKFRLDIFYSRLGNQQFNHMPIKLPTAGICDFITNLHNNYAEIAKFVVNFPKRGECPIKIREMYIFDTETPNELVPQGVIKIGLWKGLVRCYLHAKEVINYSFVLKAIED